MNAVRGRAALVTGASRGIGQAIATALASEGAELLLTARRPAPLERVAKSLDAGAFAADLTDPESIQHVLAAARDRFGRAPEVLVNNAGVFRLAPAKSLGPADLDLHLDLDLRAPIRLATGLLPEMLARRCGVLVHIGSLAGREPFPENVAYGAAKYGLRGFHEVLELELEGTGVTSVLIEPGAVDTDAWDRFEERLGRDLPARSEMSRPEDVARETIAAIATALGRCSST